LTHNEPDICKHISGLHLFLGLHRHHHRRLLIALLRRWLGALRGALATGLAIAAYLIMVGANSTVVRATFMGKLAVLAPFMDRQTNCLSCALT
jgi:predicted membrane metal-binding protein